MKKIAYFVIALALLAATAVPVLAKAPDKSNGNTPKAGNMTVPSVSSTEQEQEKQQVQDNNQQHGMQHSQIHNQNQFQEDNHNGMGMGMGDQGQSSRMRTPFYLQGTITATDAVSQTITVSVYHANAQLKTFIGITLTLQASDTTQLYKINQGNDGEPYTGNRVAIPFDQLAVNDIVAIHGNLLDGVYQTTMVTVYTPMGIGGFVGGQP